MSSGQTGHSEDDAGSEELGASARDAYKEKPASKVVRVFTVLAYLLLVSLGAILLSVYYMCVWKSPELPLLNSTEIAGLIHARVGNFSDYAAVDHNIFRGGNTTVNVSTTDAPNLTAAPYSSEAATLASELPTDSPEHPGSTLGQPDSTPGDIGSYNDTDVT